MYQESFNTKILQTITFVNKTVTHTPVVIVDLAIIVFGYSYSETFELSF